jgi:hypothetical protein
MAGEKPRKRPKLRFSLRTLAILVTLACLYLGCWIPTSTYGVRDVQKQVALETTLKTKVPVPKAPLILEVSTSSAYVFSGTPSSVVTRDYYFWFFGWVAKLPYLSTHDDNTWGDADNIMM